MRTEWYQIVRNKNMVSVSFVAMLQVTAIKGADIQNGIGVTPGSVTQANYDTVVVFLEPNDSIGPGLLMHRLTT